MRQIYELGSEYKVRVIFRTEGAALKSTEGSTEEWQSLRAPDEVLVVNAWKVRNYGYREQWLCSNKNNTSCIDNSEENGVRKDAISEIFVDDQLAYTLKDFKVQSTLWAYVSAGLYSLEYVDDLFERTECRRQH